MWISARTQYGLRALVQLAARSDITPLKTLAHLQNISEGFLEQIFADLKRLGFVSATRGLAGGYRLTRPPWGITAWEVVAALEGGLDPVDCLSLPALCAQSGACATQTLWGEVASEVRRVLESVTLEALVAQHRALEHRKLVQLEPPPP